MKCKSRFICVASNPVSSCSEWGSNGTFAYGGSNFVCLYNKELTRTLRGHKGQVTAVRWIQKGILHFFEP